MNRQTAIDRVDKAIERAKRHVAGDRDTSLADYLDPQVERFLQTLLQMRAAMDDPSADAPTKYMGMAIADGWPYESELGRLVCEAEDAFHAQLLSRSH